MECSRASSNQSSLKLSSTVTSDIGSTISDHNEKHPSIESRVCLVGSAANNENLKKKLKDLNIPHLSSEDGKEYVNENELYFETIFILEDFEGSLFENLKRTDNRILGSPVVYSVAATNEPLPYNSRPLFCTCMQGLNLCFTNFKTKDHVSHLVTLCHYMGASIRKDMSAKIDYLITNILHGPKYRKAVSLGTPVMKEEWIHRCWSARKRSDMYQATDDEFLTPCKSKPFEGCIISFLGFSEGEKQHMEEQAKEQGGSVAEVGDVGCTHLVVDENTVKSLPFKPEGKLYIIVQEWFWGSIQIEAKAAESMYIFDLVEYPKMLTRSATTSSLLGTPKWRGSTANFLGRSKGSAGKSFSRKRSRLLEETLAKFAQGTDDPARPPHKRPSTDTSACVPDSMLDMSNNTTITSLQSPNLPNNIIRGRRCSSRVSSRRRLEGIPVVVNSSQKSHHSSVHLHRHSIASPPIVLLQKESMNASSNAVDIESASVQRHETSFCESSRIREDCTSKDVSIDAILNFNDSITVRKPSTKRKLKPRERSRSKDTFPVQTEETLGQWKRQLDYSPQTNSYGTDFLTPTPHISRRFSFHTCNQRYKLLNHYEDIAEIEEDEFREKEGGDHDSNQSFTLKNHNVNSAGEAQNDLRIDVGKILQEHAVNSNPAAANSARFQVAMEFLQTEKNYVGILQTIINLFKKPLDDPNQAGGPILASEEVKAIFGSLPEIEAVHRSMNDDLQNAMMKWNDTTSIGDLVLKHAAGFVRCYPPFVNFFEESVDTISRCESRLPRFHAFLKINQSKKECGRQTLAELLINPVQRLPRIILLLQDVKKHTERENSSHPDIAAIATALESLKVVMTHINEDKRKTESQRHIFDIVYEVEGCPPTIVSSHRQFIARAELIAADDNLCKRGDHISVFIFSDCIEIAKRRRGAKSNSFKSPNVHARQSTKAKCMKHIKLMSLTHIKKMVNITDSEECQNAVAFYCRTPTDTQDWLYTFKILSCSDDSTTQSKQNSNELLTNNKENVLDDDRQKMSLLHLLAKYRASAFCKASDDNFVCVVSPCELDISTSDLGSTLGRAVRAAKKSSRKLTRAFSFSRTPRRVVQRAAVSTMLSPLTQKPLTRSDSNASVDMDVEDIPSSSSSLTPSLSVTSLCTPQRDRKAHRPASSCDDELMQFSQTPTLKSSVSTLTLARRPTEADMFDFPAIPTPPARRRKIGSTIKAATIALGRTGSFRRRNNKHETAV